MAFLNTSQTKRRPKWHPTIHVRALGTFTYFTKTATCEKRWFKVKHQCAYGEFLCFNQVSMPLIWWLSLAELSTPLWETSFWHQLIYGARWFSNLGLSGVWRRMGQISKMRCILFATFKLINLKIVKNHGPSWPENMNFFWLNVNLCFLADLKENPRVNPQSSKTTKTHATMRFHSNLFQFYSVPEFE